MSEDRKWVKDAADRLAAEQGIREARLLRMKWLGPENCEAVFAMIGWVHPLQEHEEIHGLGPEGKDVAHWGDVIGWYDGCWRVM